MSFVHARDLFTTIKMPRVCSKEVTCGRDHARLLEGVERMRHCANFNPLSLQGQSTFGDHWQLSGAGRCHWQLSGVGLHQAPPTSAQSSESDLRRSTTSLPSIESTCPENTDRYSPQFKNSYFTEMCRGSEAGSYLRLIDFCTTQLYA